METNDIENVVVTIFVELSNLTTEVVVAKLPVDFYEIKNQFINETSEIVEMKIGNVSYESEQLRQFIGTSKFHELNNTYQKMYKSLNSRAVETLAIMTDKGISEIANEMDVSLQFTYFNVYDQNHELIEADDEYQCTYDLIREMLVYTTVAGPNDKVYTYNYPMALEEVVAELESDFYDNLWQVGVDGLTNEILKDYSKKNQFA